MCPPPERYVAGRHVFGGIIQKQYGHFLTESLARYWAIKDCTDTIVWAVPDAGRPHAKYQSQLFGHLGLPPERMLFLDRPAKFAQLAIPKPGFVLGRFVSDAQIDALANFPQPDLRSPVARLWLSRSLLADVKAKVVNETDLEDRLARSGWTILHPQRASVKEQVDLFQSAAVIAGFEGSAFHTVLLCRDFKGKLVILPRAEGAGISVNFHLIAAAKKLNQVVLPQEMELLNDGKRGDSKARMKNPADVCASIESEVPPARG